MLCALRTVKRAISTVGALSGRIGAQSHAFCEHWAVAQGKTQLTETDTKRILVADDVEAVTTLLVTALEIAGYEVVVARNGQQALEYGRDQSFDLAILDQLMPGLLGIEIITQWRAAGIQLPVIVLSGVEDDEIVVGSLESGATDFMRKPFRLPELMARIKMHVS